MNIEVEFEGKHLELSKPISGYYTWYEAMDLQVDGWRLPTIEDLIDLWHEANLSGFVFEDSSSCWSSSAVAYYSYGAWQLYFYYGGDDDDFRSIGYRVRLVREIENET